MKSFRQFCEDRDYKVGEHVWIKHPTDVAVTLTGKVKKIHPNDQVTVQHKDGTTRTYPTKDASKEFQHLNRNPYEKPFSEEEVSERCWSGYKPVPGKKAYSKGSCVKEDGAGAAGGAVGVGAVAGTGASSLPASQREPGVHLPRKKKSPIMFNTFRRKPPK